MARHPFRRAALVVLGVTFVVGLIPSAAAAAHTARSTTTTTQAASSTATTKQTTEVEGPLASHAITPAPACPALYVCTTIPSSAGSTGGVVQAGPTQNLGDTQWVYVNLYQFTPGTSVEVAYCTDTEPLTAGSPLCVSSGYVLSANPAPEYSTQILSDGTQALSFQVLDIDSSNDPFRGQEPGNANVTGTFYCNSTSPCSLDVIDSGVNGLGEKTASPDNTAVFPIGFAQPFSGCGGTSASVTTESEYGIEFLLPVASAAACAGPDPTLAFNTAQDGLGAVQSLADGSAQVAFTDNPESQQQQQVLTGGNYKLIPVALSANVVGFKAEQGSGGVLYPVSTYDLTPTMAAGLLTGIYETPQSADEVQCSQSLGCPSFGGTVCTKRAGVTTCTPAPCPYHPSDQKKNQVGACSLYAELNFDNFVISQQNESFVRSDDAGSIGLAFEWLCHAPVVPVTVDIPEASGTPYVATYSDNMTAAQLIQDGFGTPSAPLKSCPNVDQYPPEPLGSTVVYTGYEDPNEQDLKMLSYVEPGLQGGNPTAAFASMNWSEALYYGLQIASLENGGGAFVTPSPTTLDAAVNDASTNPDGTLALNYSASDPNAYPMTSVIYAAVCAGRGDDADRHEHLQHAQTAPQCKWIVVHGNAAGRLCAADSWSHADSRGRYHPGCRGRCVCRRRPVGVSQHSVLQVVDIGVVHLQFHLQFGIIVGTGGFQRGRTDGVRKGGIGDREPLCTEYQRRLLEDVRSARVPRPVRTWPSGRQWGVRRQRRRSRRLPTEPHPLLELEQGIPPSRPPPGPSGSGAGAVHGLLAVSAGANHRIRPRIEAPPWLRHAQDREERLFLDVENVRWRALIP